MATATIIKIDGKRLTIKVRRARRLETSYNKLDINLQIGDRIEVERKINNPFPVLIGKAK